MGNEVSKKYNLSEEHNATAGHCQLWKIYPGYVSKTWFGSYSSYIYVPPSSALIAHPFIVTDVQVMNKDKVTTTDISVWIFTRDGLAKREPVPITDKSTQEQLMQIMKKDMSCMKEKDMQHHGIIKIFEVKGNS